MSRIPFSKPQQGVSAMALRTAHHAAAQRAEPRDPAGKLLHNSYREDALPQNFLAAAPLEEGGGFFLGEREGGCTQNLLNSDPTATAPELPSLGF